MSDTKELVNEFRNYVDAKFASLAEEINMSSVKQAERPDPSKPSGPVDEYALARIALLRAAVSLNQDPADYWAKIGGGRAYEKWMAHGPVAVEKLFKGEKYFAHQTTLIPELGGVFVTPRFGAVDLLEFLRPGSVVRRNVNNVIVSERPIPLVRVSEGTSVYPLGEGAPAQITGFKAEVVNVTAKKLGALVPLTSETITAPEEGVLQMVQNDLVNAMTSGQDRYLLVGTGAAGEPRGLRNWAQTETMTTPVNVDNVNKDLSKLIRKLKSANIPMIKPVWFISQRTEQFLLNLNNGFIYLYREEMLKNKTILGIPFEVSNHIPENLGTGGDKTFILLADMSFAVLVDGGLFDIAVSREAAFTDGAQIISAYQNDLVLVRIIGKVDIGVRHPSAVAALVDVSWGA